LNGIPRDTANRCEVTPVETVNDNLCKGHPCVADDNPNLTNSNEGFCDCYSGFSGQQCQNKGFGNNKLPAIDPTNGIFAPKISHLMPSKNISITISLPSNQSPKHNPDDAASLGGITRLKFKPSVGAHFPGKRSGDLLLSKRVTAVNGNACNYPNNVRWDLSSENNGGWIDYYHNTFDYSELIDCGLSYVGSDANYAYFNVTVLIERQFQIGNGRFSFNRDFSVDQAISIEFPRQLSVNNSVTVSNNTVEFYAAVTSISFDVINQLWDITVGTAINKPFYKLNLLPTTNPNPSIPIRDWVELGNNAVSCPGDYSGDCKQEWKFQTHSCDALNINALVLDFQVKCITGTTPNTLPGECATGNPEQVSASIQITTASACPVSKDYKISASLSSFSDDSFSTPKGLFGISEDMYLAVDFPAPPAEIQSITVKSVCAYPRFANSADVPHACVPERKIVASQIHPDLETKYGPAHKFGLHVNAGLLKAAAGVVESDNKLTIQVEFLLTYNGALNGSNKRVEPLSLSYTLSTDLTIESSIQSKEETVEYNKSSAPINSFGLLVLALVIASML